MSFLSQLQALREKPIISRVYDRSLLNEMTEMLANQVLSGKGVSPNLERMITLTRAFFDTNEVFYLDAAIYLTSQK